MVFDPSTIKPKQADTRDKKVVDLAEMLLERGLAANMPAAKRLAEGMVETEKEVLQDAKREAPAPVASSFQEFVAKAASMPAAAPAPVQAQQPLPKRGNMMYADAPKWSPEDGYAKTEVQASEDGVVVKHVENSATSHTEVEEAVIAVPEKPRNATPKQDLAKEAGIDMFDIFNANKEK
ncbi:MAG: hypothetical protein OXR66_09385 [Candidatus Woesearchaeota archaeon]|nr:hypothetical protein [Candidatus Woesearchaeota archaeon]